MWGAIIGDLAGSIYEFEQTKEIKTVSPKELITNQSFYSDDTILTMAILDAMLTDKDFESKLRFYGKQFMEYHPNFHPYFDKSFSPKFIKWLDGKVLGTSRGNGAMMRISPVGYLSDTLDEVKQYAYLATKTSHDCQESIDCATLIAQIIFFLRKGFSKAQILEYLQLELYYHPFLRFNTTCYETIHNCIYALWHSTSFEEALRTVISYGGDTDTNACIVGSMAEAMFGIDSNLITVAKEKLPEPFVKKLEYAYSKIK